MKNVQVSEALFASICRYFLLDDDSRKAEIIKGLEEKLDALKRRELYGKYKQGDEVSRKQYLDMIGMTDDFRW